MELFKCQHCSLLLFFENRSCTGCGHGVGYLPFDNQLSALEPAGQGLWQSAAAPGRTFRFCDNADFDACNWLIDTQYTERFCVACRHNRTVPDLSDANNLENWRKMELAKHRLFYTLLRLQLPLHNRTDDPKRGLVFDFLGESAATGHKVITGHDDGVITLALKEADDVEREARRTALHEPYRTLLGHFRHEIGHYYWDRLIDEGNDQQACRAIFGDDREDYADALKRHYSAGPPANWQENFVSSYATSHPWEDFAETWAHYLHIIDCIETAQAFGLQVHPRITTDQKVNTTIATDAYQAANFAQIIEEWLPITYAMNSMNRSMGLKDIYPFVLFPAVINKLEFIHHLVHAPRQATS